MSRKPGSKAAAGGLISLADIEPTQVRWLWAGRIPFGKISILEGDPDLGKSMVTCDLVARVTTGRPFPGSEQPVRRGRRRRGRDVLLVLAEDDLADTVWPRLAAAGADLNRVWSMTLARDDEGKLVPLSLPEDLERMRDNIEEVDAALVIIDPITAFLSESIQSHNDASVRKAMTPLAEVAQTTGAALLLIRHLNKAGDMKALYRGGGSIAFTGAARSVLVVDRHPDDPINMRVLAQVKANLTKNHRPSILYQVEGNEDGIPVVNWGGEIDLTAEDLLKKPDARKNAPARSEAEAFLTDLLRGNDPMRVDEVQRQADMAGVSWAAVKRAKERAGVVGARVYADGKVDHWTWTIPRSRRIVIE